MSAITVTITPSVTVQTTSGAQANGVTATLTDPNAIATAVTISSPAVVVTVSDAGITYSGSSAGNVIGPSSAIDSDIALFDGITGQKIKDSGVALSAFATAAALGTEATTRANADSALAAAIALLQGFGTVAVINDGDPDYTLLLTDRYVQLFVYADTQNIILPPLTDFPDGFWFVVQSIANGNANAFVVHTDGLDRMDGLNGGTFAQSIQRDTVFFRKAPGISGWWSQSYVDVIAPILTQIGNVESEIYGTQQIDTATITVSNTDSYIGLQSTSGQIANLPDGSTCTLGKEITIDDLGGNSGALNCAHTINAFTGDLIQGLGSLTLNQNNGTVRLRVIDVTPGASIWRVVG